LHFDGLVRNIHLFRIPELWHPREIRDLGITEIPSSPARKPDVNDLKLPELQHVIRSAAGEGRRELLAIRGIEKAVRLFRRAVALLYQSQYDPEEFRLGFAIDGKLSEEHEQAFAAARGLQKLGMPDSGSWSCSAVLKALNPAVELPKDTERIR